MELYFLLLDPFGRCVKYVILVIENYKILIVQNHLKRFIQAFYVLSLRDFIEKIRKRKQENRKIDEIPKVHLRKLLNTTWINYEIDKLVSTFYFIIALFLLIFILGNPIHFETYIKFVSPQLNSTNTNDTTLDTISNCTAVEDSKLANNSMSLYCDTRTTFFIGFIISLAVLVIVSIYSCYTLSDKIKTLKEYYEVTERIDKHPCDDKLRSELTDLWIKTF